MQERKPFWLPFFRHKYKVSVMRSAFEPDKNATLGIKHSKEIAKEISVMFEPRPGGPKNQLAQGFNLCYYL